jgi:hypothetical protein
MMMMSVNVAVDEAGFVTICNQEMLGASRIQRHSTGCTDCSTFSI